MSAALSLENLKSELNIHADVSDITFRKLTVGPYNNLERNKRFEFGEKVSLLYQADCTIFNVHVVLKILAFKYESYSEVLKLEINVCNEPLAKEIAPCKNFLQRKRNMNLAFEVLIKFTKLFEMRRLICRTVFERQANVAICTDDGTVIVKCYKNKSTVEYLELSWAITWNVDNYEVGDFIEFYFNYSVLLNKEQGIRIKQHLIELVEPNVDFHTKWKLWRNVMQELYSNSTVGEIMTDVLEIVDSDSDENDVIEIDQTYYHRPNSDEILVID